MILITNIQRSQPLANKECLKIKETHEVFYDRGDGPQIDVHLP